MTPSDHPWPSPELLPDELRRITGYQLKSKQCAYLKRHKILFRANAFGHPNPAEALPREQARCRGTLESVKWR